MDADGSLVPEPRALIDGFVNRVFVQRLERERGGENGLEPGGSGTVVQELDRAAECGRAGVFPRAGARGWR